MSEHVKYKMVPILAIEKETSHVDIKHRWWKTSSEKTLYKQVTTNTPGTSRQLKTTKGEIRN